MTEVLCSYVPLPAQWAFRCSLAKVRGYGGAMAGGKTRALCEEAFDLALEYPGILLPIFRQKHTAIINTTRRSFFEQVLPVEVRPHVYVKASQGEDFVRLWNGSEIHFVGLDDPVKWFSAEIGAVCFDEAHEIAERDVVTLMTRLRQRCRVCVRSVVAECSHMPHSVMITFNPAHPGHWLQRWFILGAERTEFGFRKEELFPEDAESSIGSAEFVFARAADNPYVSREYIAQTLAGMPAAMRRRYLEGRWEHIDGSCFFDSEALGEFDLLAMGSRPLLQGGTAGDLRGVDRGDVPRLVRRSGGPLQVFVGPVRGRWDEGLGRELPAHRYVVAVDVSSGAAQDFSAIQVVDVDELAQVAEWQAKLDPDLVAEEAFRLAAVYNGALIVVEITGGFGDPVSKRCQRLIGEWRGSAVSRPLVYTRPIWDRLSQKYTDRLGWDTNTRTRGLVLGTLEECVRERSVRVPGARTLAEMSAFVFHKGREDVLQKDFGAPRARSGSNDDLVMALAIGVHVAAGQPRQLRRVKQRERAPVFSSTGWGA